MAVPNPPWDTGTWVDTAWIDGSWGYLASSPEPDELRAVHVRVTAASAALQVQHGPAAMAREVTESAVSAARTLTVH